MPNRPSPPPSWRPPARRRRSGCRLAGRRPGRTPRACSCSASSPAASSSSARDSRSSDVAAEGIRPGQAVGGHQRPRDPRAATPARRWLQAAVDRVQVLLDDPQRQVVVALGREHVAQPGDVVAAELAVARRRALGLDQPLRLEEPDLRDGDVREVRPELGQHLTDAHERPRGADAAPAAPTAPPPHQSARSPAVAAARKTRRNLPICTSSPPASGGVVDALAVEVGAVEAADVADGEGGAVADELGVPAGDRDVVEEDVALGVAADGREVGVEQEAAAGVRPAA